MSAHAPSATDRAPSIRYVLVWMAEIEVQPLIHVRRTIEDSVTAPREQVQVDVWIESAGGEANAAFKLAILLKHIAHHIRVVIPDYAKSAATLLALVGDEIFLAPSAELGPLDAQLPQEGSFAPISALNIAKAADEVARDAVDLAIRGGGEMVQTTGLSRAETLSAMLHFSAEFSQPLVAQLDPKLVHQAKELLRVTTRYAEDLLRPKLADEAASVAQRLVEDFPTHGYVIDSTAAKSLGLPVKPIEEYDLLAPARVVHRAAEDGQSVVRFIDIGALLKDLEDKKDDVHRVEGGDDEEVNEHSETSRVEDVTGSSDDGTLTPTA